MGAWGFRPLEELDERERFAYFNAVFTPLLVAARSDLEGNRLDEYPDSLLPRVRRFWRARIQARVKRSAGGMKSVRRSSYLIFAPLPAKRFPRTEQRSETRLRASSNGQA